MKINFTALFFLLTAICFGQKSQVTVIGNVHYPMDNYNADSLYIIMEKMHPDIILHEIDSSFFTTDFRFKEPSKENEQNASERYFKSHPAVMIRPFEFQGRNEYRRKLGIKQAENSTMNLLDSLYDTGKLSKKQTATVLEYKRLTDLLNTFGYQSAIHFNNPKTDSISRLRQYYQHYEIRKVINQQKEFSKRFVTTTTNEKVSYKEAYNRFCDFWDLRNKTMAKNILFYSKKYPGKKIIVLTGYYHRYYLLEELNKANDESFEIKEFYN